MTKSVHKAQPAATALPVRSRPPERGWALFRGASDTWRSFWADVLALPKAAVDRWFITILSGFVLSSLVMGVAMFLGQRYVDRGLQEWDRGWLLRISESELLSFQRAIWIEAFGASSLLIPVVIGGIILAARAHRPLISAGIFAAYVLHDPIIITGWKLWDRARPDLIAGGIAAPELHSYPSGHAANVVATWGFFAYLWASRSGSWAERLLAFTLLALLLVIVALSRVRMGTHWPSDLIAGAAIGVAWLVTVCIADHRALKEIRRAESIS